MDNKTMTPAERKEKLKNALYYLGEALEGIDRNLTPVERISNNFYEELVEHFAFVVNELERRDIALRQIQAFAGNPDAAEGCRIISKKAREALGEE